MAETATYWDPTLPGSYSEAKLWPKPYAEAVKLDFSSEEIGDRSWKSILKKVGYEPIFWWTGYFEKAETQSEVGAYLHADGHLAVEVSTDEHLHQHRFFAEARWAPACIATELPRCVNVLASIEAAQATVHLDRTVRAFVRHGQGERTVDEWGYQTLDERRREAERYRALKQRAGT